MSDNEQQSVQPLLPAPENLRGRRLPCPVPGFREFRQEEVEQSIPARFEQQVRRFPERSAVRTREETLTYEGLNRVANHIAHAILARRGVGAEPIALLFEHGASLIAAMLGLLKAGKIYVPLDPLFPRGRLSFMLDDSQADLMVTNSGNLPLARELGRDSRSILNIDDLDSAPGAPLHPANPDLPLAPDDPVYILYSSGSTGDPKGITHSHRNVLHNIRSYTQAFRIGSGDRLTLLHSCSFASSTVDVFCALLNGAAVYPWDVKREGLSGLADWIVEQKITILSWIPTPFRHFASTLTAECGFPDVRLIVMGGEPVTQREVELYRRLFPPTCHFANKLGATETGCFRLFMTDRENLPREEVVPAGYAVEGMEVLLVDDAGQEVGFNTPGEILIKSRYLSPGYWRRPDLTEAAFTPDPAGVEPPPRRKDGACGGTLLDHGEARLYRTGDLGQMRLDSCLLHLGRKDLQVKIRGHRITLAEIEKALRDLRGFKEAVVVAEGDSEAPRADDRRLVAYLVPAEQPAPTVSVLRRALKETLPEYMIPSVFVMLEALPLTPGGKLDRRALPMPDHQRPALDIPFVAPRTPVEELLARIWAEVLGLDQVGIHDPFLELGGHSLQATQVLSRVQNSLSAQLSHRRFLESPTIAGLAEAVTQSLAERAGPEAMTDLLAELDRLSAKEARGRLAAEAG